MCFQVTPGNAKTQSWDTKTVWQRIPSTGSQQQNTDDCYCPVDTAERSSSADWRTAGVDDWWRRLFVCNFPSCTAELFHEDIGTSARRAWIVLGRRHLASGVRRAVAATSRYRTNDAGSRVHHKLQLVCCDLRRPGQYGVTVVNARSHKRIDECCC